MRREKRAGLRFPVGRIERFVRATRPAGRLSNSAPIYLTAVLEQVARQILGFAIAEARGRKSSRVQAKHLDAALRHSELRRLFGDDRVYIGGVVV